MIYKDKLKELREKMGLTQKQMANIIDISGSLYNEYETEYKLIPTKHLNILCNYFNVSFDYIFTNTTKNEYLNIRQNIDTAKTSIRLKELRKENKLTQAKLANILRTANTTISGYELGTRIIATPFLYTISKKYHISADYLLGRSDTPKYLK